MATEAKLTEINPFDLRTPSGKGLHIGIAVAEWNGQVTHALLDGAMETLIRHGVNSKDITVWQVPGAFELTYASAQLMRKEGIDAVIALGCIVRGETPHFDFISQGVTFGITRLNMGIMPEMVSGTLFNLQSKPVIFGVLTTENIEQALDRAGGRLGNKGSEAAEAAIKMCNLDKLK
ncbi:6,7-dimethyl-8-ribityllumazine synthase [Porphyromonas macacae]|uniref:6,7-dimethyl-8-ribityllumazine synthase n=1 Tax=Porphyromonas macacae TaxID=28115 RepID=A0A379DHJ2_9PORP|nr:6,7-dimethyl-8-ribityllumazine synthase [Porphyromonas macacae]SUB77622.1 6,7-dimethyl-8-ribityllumazine synthase [Porphyromonas macacae]